MRPVAGELGEPVTPPSRRPSVRVLTDSGRRRSRWSTSTAAASSAAWPSAVPAGTSPLPHRRTPLVGSGTWPRSSPCSRSRARPPAARRHDPAALPRPRRRLHPRRGRVWVTSGESLTIAIYEAGGRLVRTIAADAPPQHVTFMGDRAFVTSGDDAVLRCTLSTAGGSARRRCRSARTTSKSGHRWILSPSLARRMLLRPAPARSAARRAPGGRSSHDACFIVGT